MIVLNERHLSRMLHEYVDNYTRGGRPGRLILIHLTGENHVRSPATQPELSAVGVLGGLQSE